MSSSAVIVGGGFAGLYAAWLLLRGGAGSHELLHVTLVESQPKCGGRARQIRYGGKGAGGRLVAGGAGIGRLAKDHCLRELLDSFGVPWKPFPRKVRHISKGNGATPHELPGASARFKAMLRKLQQSRPRHTETFRAFVRRALGKAGAATFFQLSGFGDDADADAAHTLRQYGFDDNVVSKGQMGMAVPWNDLVAAMVRWLRAHPRATVLTSTKAVSVKKRQAGYAVTLQTGTRRSRLHCDALMLALPASGMRALLRGVAPKVCGLERVRAQSFAYVYARAAGRSSAATLRKLLPYYTVLVGATPSPAAKGSGKAVSPLQKMIPMGGNVYMIGYADNANARRVRRLSCSELLRMAEGALLGVAPSRALLTGCMKRWIPEGTHYWSPASAASKCPQKPPQLREAIRRALPPGLFLAGEALSVDNQGWVEGALRDAREEVLRMQRGLRRTSPRARHAAKSAS